ncbi:eukaryotic aspartyl protease family protein [Stylonychia lemnae]|uniref:Eukaryotic aspartyl protease family protein n=1 Tax=Stylonychia lemnae TaxID=5949 RepID=A0A078AT88_STYLE|nr:eukaryotic aspartyl protease family protein [Stylonychia lemnae]|eukprot:CDW84093.1 eukaryotic aspartyl protease family protein [Stylonychia lemnae]
MQYFIELELGSQRQKMSFLIDTGSSYGMGSVEGLYAQDNFYFPGSENKSQTINDFHFLAVEEAKKLGFGGYDENLTQNSSYKFVWLYLRSAKTIWWEIEMSKAKYGAYDIDLTVKFATLDTGSSIIYMPQVDFRQIYAKINQKNINKCQESGGLIYCYKCPETDGQYEPITIILNVNIQIKLTPEFYMQYDKGYDRCLLTLKGVQGELNHWVLGDSFLRAFYQVYDPDNYRVGLMMNPYNLGLEHDDLISYYQDDSIDKLYLFISMGLISLMILLIGAIIFLNKDYLVRKFKKNKVLDKVSVKAQLPPNINQQNQVFPSEQNVVKIDSSQENNNPLNVSQRSSNSYSSISQDSLVSSSNSYYSSSGSGSRNTSLSSITSLDEKPLTNRHRNKQVMVGQFAMATFK